MEDVSIDVGICDGCHKNPAYIWPEFDSWLCLECTNEKLSKLLVITMAVAVFSSVLALAFISEFIIRPDCV